MRHDHLKKELELMLMLVQNRGYTAEEICNRCNISRRSFYYFLNFFREAGFIVEKHGSYFSLSRNSEFFKKLFDIVQFTDEEAVLIRQMIENSDQKSVRLKALEQKLERFYDFKILENESMQVRTSRTIQRIHEAIKMHKMIKIIGYSSPNSHTVKDRIVEPFLFMNNNNDVRCYELGSGKNKTFRLSRMQGVEIIETEWIHEDKHRKVYTDLFMFSGEERTTITLILGQLSRNVMLEEHPNSAPCMAEQPDGRWLFRTEVCSFLGIGRFVFGLYDDIEIVGNDDFIQYIKAKINSWAGK